MILNILSDYVFAASATTTETLVRETLHTRFLSLTGVDVRSRSILNMDLASASWLLLTILPVRMPASNAHSPMCVSLFLMLYFIAWNILLIPRGWSNHISFKIYYPFCTSQNNIWIFIHWKREKKINREKEMKLIVNFNKDKCIERISYSLELFYKLLFHQDSLLYILYLAPFLHMTRQSWK